MNKRIYRGIPYLGEDTPNMYKRIRNNIRFKTIHTTFYDMWYNLEPNRYLAIVEDHKFHSVIIEKVVKDFKLSR